MAVICHACQQRPSALHITQVTPGGVLEAHLCPTCASALDLSADGDAPDLATLDLTRALAPAPASEERRCATCGVSMADYRQSNLLGCADCWRDLGAPLLAMVRRFHDADAHVGWRPDAAGDGAEAAAQRRELERRLHQAVAEERFEEAARLRDQLRHP